MKAIFSQTRDQGSQLCSEYMRVNQRTLAASSPLPIPRKTGHRLHSHTGGSTPPPLSLPPGPIAAQIQVKSVRDIEAGEELYAHYGNQIDREGWRPGPFRGPKAPHPSAAGGGVQSKNLLRAQGACFTPIGLSEMGRRSGLAACWDPVHGPLFGARPPPTNQPRVDGLDWRREVNNPILAIQPSNPPVDRGLHESPCWTVRFAAPDSPGAVFSQNSFCRCSLFLLTSQTPLKKNPSFCGVYSTER